MKLRCGMAVLCGAQIAPGGIAKIGGDPQPARVEQPQLIERLGLAGGGKPRPFPERGGVIPALKGRNAPLRVGSWMASPKAVEIDHGSRMASPTPRITPRHMYMKADRVPTWMSAVRVMPGTRRKLSGTDLRLTSVSAMRAL